MEIITIPLEGSLKSMKTVWEMEASLKMGIFKRRALVKGIRHSEYMPTKELEKKRSSNSGSILTRKI